MTDPAPLVSLQALACDPPCAATVVARDGEAARTRGMLADRAAGWAAAFEARGARNLALGSVDGFELLAMILGAWRAAATAWLPADVLPATLAALRGHVDGFAGGFSGVECIAPLPGGGSPGVALAPDARLVVFTSGSTGDPVAMPRSRAQLEAEIHALHARWGRQAAAALVVASVPDRHLYGLLFKLLWPAMRGAPFLSRSLGFPEEILAALQREPCVWVASPALLGRLPPDLDWPRARPNVRAVFSSGGPLEAEAARRVRALLGTGVTEVFGSSETGGIASRVQDDGPGGWLPLPGVEVDCDAADGALAVRSPWLGTAGWVKTADRAVRSADGSFLLQGRVDRIVKVEGKRVSLDGVERALGLDPRVAALRVVQMRDGRLGAVVVPGVAGPPPTGRVAAQLARELRARLSAAVDPVAQPRRWRFVAELPRDAMGKCTAQACLALLEQPRGEPRILSEEGDAACRLLRLRVARSLPWFDGHFPGVAVLPGVVQVHWAIGFARERFAIAGRFRALEQLKFQRMIQPPATLELELRHDAGRGRISFEYRSGGGTHSSGRVVFA